MGVDGREVAEFRLDEEAAAWVPIAWRLDTTERFLFKKFVMEGRVEYAGFEWTAPRAEPSEE